MGSRNDSGTWRSVTRTSRLSRRPGGGVPRGATSRGHQRAGARHGPLHQVHELRLMSIMARGRIPRDLFEAIRKSVGDPFAADRLEFIDRWCCAVALDPPLVCDINDQTDDALWVGSLSLDIRLEIFRSTNHSSRLKPGQLAPFVPSAPKVVAAMLAMAKVGKDDTLIDLGCGDGRIVIAAAKRGARAIGIDYDPERIAEARQAAELAGVADRVEFREQEILATDVSEATVVTLYLCQTPTSNSAIRCGATPTRGARRLARFQHPRVGARRRAEGQEPRRDRLHGLSVARAGSRGDADARPTGGGGMRSMALWCRDLKTGTVPRGETPTPVTFVYPYYENRSSSRRRSIAGGTTRRTWPRRSRSSWSMMGRRPRRPRRSSTPSRRARATAPVSDRRRRAVELAGRPQHRRASRGSRLAAPDRHGSCGARGHAAHDR